MNKTIYYLSMETQNKSENRDGYFDSREKLNTGIDKLVSDVLKNDNFFETEITFLVKEVGINYVS